MSRGARSAATIGEAATLLEDTGQTASSRELRITEASAYAENRRCRDGLQDLRHRATVAEQNGDVIGLVPLSEIRSEVLEGLGDLRQASK